MQPKVRRVNVEDIHVMFDISVRAHKKLYDKFIPPSGRAAFNRYYGSDASRLKYVANMVPRVNNPAWLMWVAELDGRVVGFTVEEVVSESLLQKRGLFVDPAHQGRGMGGLLFEKSLEIVPAGGRVRLSVLEENHPARALYEKYNFNVVGYDSRLFYGAKQVIMEWVNIDNIQQK